MHQLARSSRPGAGRPTREQAEQRHLELLDRALELFLEKGFELATIEAIAASVGMTKRTVYARYEDKRALFKAAVERAIERWVVPMETLRALETADLEETLIRVARVRMANALSPAGVSLQRVISSESYRFPEIFSLAYEQGGRPTIDFLVDLLQRKTASGEIQLESPRIAAGVFLSMVLAAPARAFWGGQQMDEAEVEARIQVSVRLFLNGARPR